MTRSFVASYDWGQAEPNLTKRRGKENGARRERAQVKVPVTVGGVSPVTGEVVTQRHHGVRKSDLNHGVKGDGDGVTEVGIVEHALIHYAKYRRTGDRGELNAAHAQIGNMTPSEKDFFDRVSNDGDYMLRFGGLEPIVVRGRN